MNKTKLIYAVIEVRTSSSGNEYRLQYMRKIGRIAGLFWKLKLAAQKKFGYHPDADRVARRMSVPVTIDHGVINHWLHTRSDLPELLRSHTVVLRADSTTAPAPEPEAVCV